MKTLILIPILLLQGCMVAAIGAGIGAVRYANAEKSKAHTACKDSYIPQNPNQLPFSGRGDLH